MKLSINTSKGKFCYKFVPLYAGTKIIDRGISKRNLSLFSRVLRDNDIKTILFYGTLLGAVREHDFISHDEDIDLAILAKDEKKLIDSLFDFRQNGFEVCRFDRRGVISFMKDGEYIDIYIFKSYKPGILACSLDLVPEKYLKDVCECDFLGGVYFIPRNYAEFLSYYYGDDWMTPIKYFYYQQPLIKRIVNISVQYIKEFLPDWIFYLLIRRKESKYRRKFEMKIREMDLL